MSDCGRIIRAKFKTDTNIDLTILAVYAPANKAERKIWMRDSLSKDWGKIDILAGDFNTLPEIIDPRSYPNTLRALAASNNLIDVTPTNDQTTYWGPKGSTSRLDRIYLKSQWWQGIKSMTSTRTNFSDHALLIMEVNLVTAPQRKNQPWRLDTYTGKTYKPLAKSQQH